LAIFRSATSPAPLICRVPVFGLAKSLSTPYVMNWNANVQQAMWKNAALTIAYVGNKGTRLYNIRDTNQNIFANDTAGDAVRQAVRRTIPHFKQYLRAGQRI
jgi:hypothetical protein